MSTKNNKQQKQIEQRKIALILLIFVLAIFSLGIIFGCFLRSSFSAKVTDTEKPKPKPTTTAVVASPAPDFYSLQIESDECTLDTELQIFMVDMCEKYGLPFALVLAVAEQESGFNPDEISATNDYGIMQINECNFKWLREIGIEPLDYKGNIEAGVMMLSEAIKKHGEYNLALMVYNCGDTGAKRLWKQGIYSTEYSRSTMERFDKWDNYIRGV